MARAATPVVDLNPVLAQAGAGRTIVVFGRTDTVFSQGERAEAMFDLRKGEVRLTVVSQQGKEAVIAMLGPGGFFGEGSPAGQRLRMRRRPQRPKVLC